MFNIYKFLAWLITAASWPIIVRAKVQTINLSNPLEEFDNILQGGSYVGSVIAQILAIVGALSLLMLIYGGLTMILAGGNDARINKGKAIITYTAIGLIVIFTAYVVISFTIKSLSGQAT